MFSTASFKSKCLFNYRKHVFLALNETFPFVIKLKSCRIVRVRAVVAFGHKREMFQRCSPSWVSVFKGVFFRKPVRYNCTAIRMYGALRDFL